MHRYLKAIGSRVLGTQRESPGYGLLATGLLFLIVHDWLMKQERHAAVTAFQFFFFFIDESLSRCNKTHVYTAWRGCGDRTDMAPRLSF